MCFLYLSFAIYTPILRPHTYLSIFCIGDFCLIFPYFLLLHPLESIGLGCSASTLERTWLLYSFWFEFFQPSFQGVRAAEVRLKEAREKSISHVDNLTNDVAVDANK